MGGPAAGRWTTAGGRHKEEGLQRQAGSGAGQSSTFSDPPYSPSYYSYVQVDIVDLRAETNAISLARDQSSAFRKSSESQTDAAEVNSLALVFIQYMDDKPSKRILLEDRIIDYVDTTVVHTVM